MKKILLILTVVLSSLAASAQESATSTAVSLNKGKSSGVFEFVLPATVTTEQVEKVQTHYTHYFTVAFDQNTHQATLTMTKNEPINRRVMHRFLASLNVQTIKVDAQEYTFDALFDKYLQ